MNAPAVVSADLPDRILAAIGLASSQHPARADQVRARLDVAMTEFEPALEALAAECRINTAQIQRKGDASPWLAIWPTGVQLPSAGWTGKSHRALFVRDAPIVPALRAASAPRVRQSEPTPRAAARPPKQEEPAMRHYKRGELPRVVLGVLRRASEPLTVAEVAARIDSSVENTRQLIYRLVDKGEVEKVGERQGLGGSAHCFRATRVPAPEEAERASVSVRTADRFGFALWDTGDLDIHFDGDTTTLPPEAVERLARLLGVPAPNDYPLKGA